jgi:hypothetical protein
MRIAHPAHCSPSIGLKKLIENQWGKEKRKSEKTSF